MRTRGSRMSVGRGRIHDVKQRSVLRSRGALLRAGWSAWSQLPSLPSLTAAVDAAAAGRHSPHRIQDRLRRLTSTSENANPVYCKFVT
jgi:hypothetical protein